MGTCLPGGPQLSLPLIVVPHIGIVVGVSGGNNMFAIDATSMQKQASTFVLNKGDCSCVPSASSSAAAAAATFLTAELQTDEEKLKTKMNHAHEPDPRDNVSA